MNGHMSGPGFSLDLELGDVRVRSSSRTLESPTATVTLEQIADAYYVRAGNTPVPLRHTDADLSLNEQHRRLTQILFTPVFREVRGDRRFVKICERIGLRQHWDDIGEEPDFLNPGAVTDSTNRQNGAAV